MYKKFLKDADEIAEFIVESSPGFIDEDLVREYFFGCHAVLRTVRLETITAESVSHHVRNRFKEKIYEKLPLSTMPPLIVENGKIIDGHHRFRLAKRRQQKEIPVYIIHYE